MKHKTRCLALLLALVLAVALAVPALAALNRKTIEVYTGVNIYVDDYLLEPKDANGNPVEAFVYNGTTYLPVRAVGEAVGKTVQWEGKTNSVYLGKHTGDTPAVWLEDLDYFTGEHISTSDPEAKVDNLGNTYDHATSENIYNTYLINGQYSAISGTIYQMYEYRSSTMRRATLRIYGDDELLYEAQVTGGVEPIDFYVDLTGVLKLTVDFYQERLTMFNHWDNESALGNCGLWT